MEDVDITGEVQGNKSEEEEIDDFLRSFGDDFLEEVYIEEDVDITGRSYRDYFQGRPIVIEHVGSFGAGI